MLKILYITRTFGPVGGMECYAFEVAREMALRGHQVSALCRSVDEPNVADSGVEIIKLQPKLAKRGWQDRHLFRDAVTEFFSVPANRQRFDIVHSHENTIEQDVTTEHGPCTELVGRRFTHLVSPSWSELSAEHEALYGLVLNHRVSPD
jgi:hypothetical protein